MYCISVRNSEFLKIAALPCLVLTAITVSLRIIRMARTRSFIFSISAIAAIMAASLSFLNLSFAFPVPASSASGAVDDFEIVHKLFNITARDISRENRLHQSPRIACGWTGITCSASYLGRIVVIQAPLMNISGSIPADVGNLPLLQVLNLSHNSFEGNIPASLGRLRNIEHLDLAGNKLEGSIPSEFCNLPLSVSLDLSHNNLSGEIPGCLTRIKGSVKLDFNKLSGSIPCVTGQWSFEGNPDLLNLCRFPTFPHLDIPLSSTRPPKNGSMVIVIEYVAVAGIIVFIFIMTSYWKKPRKEIPRAACARSSSSSSLSQTMHGFMLLSREELTEATDNFSSQNLLGGGRHGPVYRGTLANGVVVAVKVLATEEEENSNMANIYFLRACETLGMTRHRHLVKIITACSSESMKALILEFIPNGSLEDLLHRPNYEDGSLIFLDLKTRVRLLREVASALSYLHHHCTPQIIHGNVNPSIVLLDQDMTAHLSDFGMHGIIIDNSSHANTLQMQRTSGYIPPEHESGTHPRSEGDVYSFGVLISEVLTRTKPMDSVQLSKWVIEALKEGTEKVSNLVLSRDGQNELQGEDFAVVTELLKLGLWCTSERPDLRPSMLQVESVLEIVISTLPGQIRRNSLSLGINIEELLLAYAPEIRDFR